MAWNYRLFRIDVSIIASCGALGRWRRRCRKQLVVDWSKRWQRSRYSVRERYSVVSWTQLAAWSTPLKPFIRSKTSVVWTCSASSSRCTSNNRRTFNILVYNCAIGCSKSCQSLWVDCVDFCALPVAYVRAAVNRFCRRHRSQQFDYELTEQYKNNT